MDSNKFVLIIGQILLGIQWLRMTLAMGTLLILKQNELIIGMLETYYLVMIGFIICSGFLYIKDSQTTRQKRTIKVRNAQEVRSWLKRKQPRR